MVIEGRSYATVDEQILAGDEWVSQGYFSALGIPILAGRNFEVTDTPESEQVAIINRAFVDLHFNGEDPIGVRMRRGENSQDSWKRIIGVVPVIRRPMEGTEGNRTDGAAFYRFAAQNLGRGYGWQTVFLRSSGDPHKHAKATRGIILEIDPLIPVDWIRTVDETWRKWTVMNRFLVSIFSIFGLSALFLAGMGVYGLVYFSMEQRHREIGIRMALGARRREILALFVSRSVFPTISALGLGCALGYFLSVLLMGYIDQRFDFHPGTYAQVVLLLVAVSVIATVIPVARACRAKPIDLLR
jgi:putative ABC transport system permease protein